MERLRTQPEVVGHALASSLGSETNPATTEARNRSSVHEGVSAMKLLAVLIGILAVGVVFFILGLQVTMNAANAAPPPKALPPSMQSGSNVVYPERTKLDFEGAQIEGELRNPGEFYFLSRESEKFDSLVKRRKNFHREMLRDVVLTK